MPGEWNRTMVYGFVSLIVISSIFGAYLFVTLKTPGSNNIQAAYLAVDSTVFNLTTARVSNVTGLETSLSLNATTLVPAQWISITISENNTLNKANILNASDKWPVQYLSLGPCSGNYPIRIGVFEGYYTLANVSEISGNQVVHFSRPGVYNCPAEFNVAAYSFQPSSNLANYSNICEGSNSPGCLVPMTGTIQLNGSWTGGNEFGVGSTDNALNPGTYTVIGADEWGQIVLQHFAVINVKVVSVIGPIAPYNPAGPTVSVTLMNVADMPIISLNASLRFESQLALANSYSFVFPVSKSSPLLPDQSINDTQTLVDAGFDSSQSYHLIITGSFENGAEFSYIQLVQIIPSVN